MTSKPEGDPFQVIVRGDLDEVLRLIETGGNVNKVRWSGFSLLHRAAQTGQTDVCQLLIDNGADVNIRSTRGWYTPLHSALANGYVQTAEYLLMRGAKHHIKSKYNEDPFDYGAKKGFKTISVDLRNKMMKREMALSLQHHNQLFSKSSS